ncbi:hypothetical protein QJS10_CPB14g01447 [Acorus calamus]|uniref:Uncharacterized protein n=1 Tax=Acorus calamus TaxID=4465 RepID=A0AAV9DFE8_ACOCL|nr:hypothetical protein QJS10_CPB14g01447 [Acorus calamus]
MAQVPSMIHLTQCLFLCSQFPKPHPKGCLIPVHERNFHSLFRRKFHSNLNDASFAIRRATSEDVCAQLLHFLGIFDWPTLVNMSEYRVRSFCLHLSINGCGLMAPNKRRDCKEFGQC